MKKYVSLANDEPTEKKSLKFDTEFTLKPEFFSKFDPETLFYIFYYMPRDPLQLYAAEELCRRKWKYNTDYAIWITYDIADLNKENFEKKEKINSEHFHYFNPSEWKIMPYVYGPLNSKAFITENEMSWYSKFLKQDDK